VLADGVRQIKMHGRYVPVRAEVVVLPAFSAHADREELIFWLGTADSPPERVYLVHGEPDAPSKLSDSIAGQFAWNTLVPSFGEQARLN
jgi:metallo-beta-lactamase family protein